MSTKVKTRAEIEADIATKRARQQRLPAVWPEYRELSAEIDALVQQWLKASA